jgi:predicted peroxiredoxin
MVLGVFVLISSALLASAQVWACEAIVVTFKQDLAVTTPRGRSLPIIDSAAVEAACVATALARNLQIAAVGEKGTGKKVSMFPALGGVKLANERFLIDSKAGAELCFDPDKDKHGYKSSDFAVAVPDDYTLLIDLVRQFLDVGGRMVVCPLCWLSREYPSEDLIDGAIIGDEQTVGPLFLKAKKVIDF